MKKLLGLVMATAVAILSGCGDNSPTATPNPTPEAVAQDFVKAMSSGKADDAYLNANCTDKTLQWLKEGAKELGKQGWQDVLATIFGDIKDKVIETKIEGDEAKVFFETKDGHKADIGLKKSGDKWKVDFAIK